MQAIRPIVIVLLSLWPATGFALDHDNLDPNRPIGMEDAYALPKGEIGLEGGVGFNDRREGRTRVTFQPQIIYGAFYNTQIEIQGDLFTEPNTLVGANKSGDLHLGVLYKLQYRDIEPSGPGRPSRGEPAHRREFTGRRYSNDRHPHALIRGLRAHLNAGYTILGSPQGQERPGAYRVVTAVSYPLGYPTSFRDTLIASVYT
jgi:hypothetical protein